jgi:hypothetical protein
LMFSPTVLVQIEIHVSTHSIHLNHVLFVLSYFRVSKMTRRVDCGDIKSQNLWSVEEGDVKQPFERFDGNSNKDPFGFAFVLEEISGEGEEEERGANGTNPFGRPLEGLLAALPAIVFAAVEGDA